MIDTEVPNGQAMFTHDVDKHNTMITRQIHDSYDLLRRMWYIILFSYLYFYYHWLHCT